MESFKKEIIQILNKHNLSKLQIRVIFDEVLYEYNTTTRTIGGDTIVKYFSYNTVGNSENSFN